MLTHEVERIVYEDREVEVIVEVEKEIEVIVEKEVEVYIEDTGQDAADIWVEHFEQPTSVNGVDILWVIDPSGSMNDDAPRILAGIDAMMNALPVSGWRLAIIPSDFRFSEQEAQFPLIPGDTPEMAENMYNQALRGAYEAGFDAAYGYIMNNSYAQTWLRDDAALLIVFVSDEDDQSFAYINSPSHFVSWVSGIRNTVGIASIIHLDPSVSLCNYNAGFTGLNYMDGTNPFNGQIVDICSDDWSAGVADASNQIAPHEYWDLAYQPLYDDRIYVFVDGVIYTDWYYEPAENRVYFTVLPEGGTLVEIAYYYQ
tara:strand:- start:1852 stop:2790 length:939 start_codon:yes stop_codon:yes gene_type:complete